MDEVELSHGRVRVRFLNLNRVNPHPNSTPATGFGRQRSSGPSCWTCRKGVCLHCQKPLSKQTQVDHFVPWSGFPADLGDNFVLAHDKCNNAKSDFLAAENHLAAWIERNREHQVELQTRLVEAALPCDLTATVQVAKWVYQQTEKANGQVWVVEKVLRHLSADWSKCFAA
jgi:HNH endonuclease